MEVVERRKKLREEVIIKASKWAKNLPFKATAILIGSYTRGDFNLWSDVDILLISNDLKGKPLERLKSLTVPAGFQVIPQTPKEFKTNLKKKSPMAIEAIKSGIVLREDLKLIRGALPSTN